ncbi:hypothetical protein GCM10027610_023780 [Dactylosporangium cerinum]
MRDAGFDGLVDELADVVGGGVQEDLGDPGQGGGEGGRVGEVEFHRLHAVGEVEFGRVGGGDLHGQALVMQQAQQVGGDRAAASGDEDHVVRSFVLDVVVG